LTREQLVRGAIDPLVAITAFESHARDFFAFHAAINHSINSLKAMLDWFKLGQTDFGIFF